MRTVLALLTYFTFIPTNWVRRWEKWTNPTKPALKKALCAKPTPIAPTAKNASKAPASMFAIRIPVLPDIAWMKAVIHIPVSPV